MLFLHLNQINPIQFIVKKSVDFKVIGFIQDFDHIFDKILQVTFFKIWVNVGHIFVDVK